MGAGGAAAGAGGVGGDAGSPDGNGGMLGVLGADSAGVAGVFSVDSGSEGSRGSDMDRFCQRSPTKNEACAPAADSRLDGRSQVNVARYPLSLTRDSIGSGVRRVFREMWGRYGGVHQKAQQTGRFPGCAHGPSRTLRSRDRRR